MGQSREKITMVGQTRPPVSTHKPDHTTAQWYIDLSGELVKLEFEELIARDTMPIPMPIDREGYLPNHDHFYWASGHTDWINLSAAIAQFGIQPQSTNKRIRLLDVGCATGRVLRHIYLFGGGSIECWGTDLAPANIKWMQRHLPLEITTNSNTTQPRLDYPDDFFDVVTGFSLMPHIDEDEIQWLRELNRITHPNGLLYLSVANEATWTVAAQRENTIKYFENTNVVPGNEPFSKSTFEQPLSGERTVRKVSNESIYDCFIWHSNRYLHDHWGPIVRIERIVNQAHMRYQSVLLARPV